MVNSMQMVKVIQWCAIFIIFFLVLFRYVSGDIFFTDEADIMVGGKTIASGYYLYSDFESQHMPISYFISALFDFLGAKTVFMQRICWYLFFAFMWTIIYIRYNGLVGKIALVLYPIIFVCLTLTYDMGHAVLSEHIAAIGFVILFLEFLKYYDNCELTIDSCIFISLSIVLSFGTIFIAAFGVFIIAVGFVLREIQYVYQNNIDIKMFIKSFVCKFIKLSIIVAIPWVIIFAYFYITNTTFDFLYSAYWVNRKFYPEYTPIGGSVSGTVFSGFSYTSELVQSIFLVEDFSINKIIWGISFVAILSSILWLHNKRGWLYSVITIGFILLLSIRGIFCFHGTQVVGVYALLIAIFIGNYISEKFRHDNNMMHWKKVALITLAIIVATPFIAGISTYTLENVNITKELDRNERIVEMLTEEDEAIGIVCFANDIPMDVDRPSVMQAATTPWTWKANKRTEMKKWNNKNTQPRVVIYKPEHEVWDYKQKDYAPEFQKMIENNYRKISDRVYVRNDYFDEAKGIIDGSKI